MLYEALRDYARRDVCPMHMPGHKRNTGLLGEDFPYQLDITEIPGFDQLYRSKGILLEAARAAGRLYGSRRSFLLVNGSTVGLLAAVRALAGRGGKLIMGRNCHRSVYHAAELCALETVYLWPEADEATGIAGGITPGQVALALAAHPDAALVAVTSPTFEGVVSDLEGISAVTKAHGVPLLVDEAHGAHLGFSPRFGARAIQCGADVAVASLHKTLPALNQCSLLHVGQDAPEGLERALDRALEMLQTSSPSYLLLASADRCVELLGARGPELFAQYENNLDRFGAAASGLKRLGVLCHGNDRPERHPRFFRHDPGKLVLLGGGAGITGPALAGLLRERYGIETEMAGAAFALAMTSICDPASSFDRLADALLDIDRTAPAAPPLSPPVRVAAPPLPAIPIHRAGELEGQYLPAERWPGTVALEYVWAYPPGVPLIAPGERPDAAFAARLEQLSRAGVTLYSSEERLPLLRCALSAPEAL
ncbi:Arginine decarboxylase [bioreactor metagenome]|uniref:Arginine decarboxylase n=1 Tax=bioreactor metagenome TaxID=1076179 RepID=A0A644ZGM9_9ZZZZ